MKRFFALVLALGILLGSVTGAAAAAPGGKYAKVQQEQDASAAFMTGVVCSLLGRIVPEEPETPKEEIPRSMRAKYWGLPENIAWIENPKTNEDIENNILFSFLNGNYSFWFENLTIKQADWLSEQVHDERYIKRLACSYPELAGALANVFAGCGNYVSADREGHFFIDFPKLEQAETTDDMLYQQQLDALNEALAISKKLHEDGTIRDGMPQMEIAVVYYNYLRSLDVQPGGGADVVETGETALLDSAWACLVNKKADCVGRAAGFNLLMHIEGVSAQGVRGSFQGTGSGHVLSRVILDGEEYFCDWGNGLEILPQEDFKTKYDFNFDADSLAYAKAHD